MLVGAAVLVASALVGLLLPAGRAVKAAPASATAEGAVPATAPPVEAAVSAG